MAEPESNGKDFIKSLYESISEEDAGKMFYPVCGTAYGIEVFLFLLGIILKRAFFVPQLLIAIVGIFPFIVICPKLNEKMQSIGFIFLRSYPIFLISGFVSMPVFALAKKMKELGLGTGIAALSLLFTLITTVVVIALQLSDSGKKVIELMKDKLSKGLDADEDKIERPGDVKLCINKDTGKDEIWHYKDRFLHMLILGPTGSGKTSQTILPLVYQDMQNTEAGITIMEPKGDLAQKAAMMAKHFGREAIYFDPSFKNCPHFNPLFGKESDVIENIATTFRMLNPDSPQFFLDLNEQLVRNAVKVLKRLDRNEGIDGRHATLVNLSRLLQNSGGAGRKMVVEFSQIKTKTDSEAKENADIVSWFLNDYFAERSKVYENTSGLRSQVAKLVSNEYLREVLNPDYDAGERNEIDFDKHLAEGGVICISTAQGTLRDLGRFLGYFIILQLQSAVFRRPGNEDTRRAHFLYIDEFQTYSNPGFSDMLTQGRSYRVACHLATQARAQMAMGGGKDGKNFVELVSTNARNIIFYPGCSKDDAKYYSEQFGEYEKVEVQVGKSYKTFNPITGGFERLGHPTETVREAKKMTAIFSPSELIYRPFGEIVYCIIKRNSVQIPHVGQISYIPKDINDKLDEMIENYIAENSWGSDEGETSDGAEPMPGKDEKKIIFADSDYELEDPAAADLKETTEKQLSEKNTVFQPDAASDDREMYGDNSSDHVDEEEHEDSSVNHAPDLFENTYMDDAMDDAEDDYLL